MKDKSNYRIFQDKQLNLDLKANIDFFEILDVLKNYTINNICLVEFHLYKKREWVGKVDVKKVMMRLIKGRTTEY